MVHYDGSVRNAEGCIVQFAYGCDGLDPTYMEGEFLFTGWVNENFPPQFF